MYPERVASVLKDWIVEVNNSTNENLQKYFTSWMFSKFSSGEPNENHKLIVGTNYNFILTSNYDNLLEKAARIGKFEEINRNTYSYKDKSTYDKLASRIYSDSPTLIHVHGDLHGIALDEFVFTSEDYVKIVRNYPGFRMMLQSLFLKYSVLFVGYGGSDPHLESFMEEIAYFMNWSMLPELPRYYMVLKRKKAGAILNKYKSKLRTTIIEIDEYKEMTSLLRRLKLAAPRK